MTDFSFLQNAASGEWVILAPHRAERPNDAYGQIICPFCQGKEDGEEELYRVGGEAGDRNWQIRVIANKFPFAPIHEIIVHSPDHTVDFRELEHDHIVLLLKTYKKRYQLHQDRGQIIIFHNRGIAAGESIPHAHTQLAVLPKEIEIVAKPIGVIDLAEIAIETDYFFIFCPRSSQWPDEVWIASRRKDTVFGDIELGEVDNLAFVMKQIISLLSKRHEGNFPFNFFIYPGRNWYLRITPRLKIPGGFEIATGIYVNTQDSRETLEFIKQNFSLKRHEDIQPEHKAKYHKAA